MSGQHPHRMGPPGHRPPFFEVGESVLIQGNPENPVWPAVVVACNWMRGKEKPQGGWAYKLQGLGTVRIWEESLKKDYSPCRHTFVQLMATVGARVDG